MNLEILTQLPPRSEIISELLKRGVNAFDYFPKQQQFADSVNIFSSKKEQDTFIYGGAMGGGKTHVCLSLFIELALLYPGSKWTIMREDLPRLKDTVIPDFKRLGEHIYKKYHERDHIAEFSNGSIIEFKAEAIKDDPELDRLKGYSTNGFFLEQLEEFQEKTYELCHIRKGRWRIDPMPPQILLASINPTLNWCKGRFYDPYIKNELPKNIVYVPALIEDNPILFEDKQYMKGFENLDEITYKRFIEGNWSAFAVNKPFVYAFEDKHISEEAVLNPRETVYAVFDFNVDPITCSINQFGQGWYYTIDEFRLENSDLYELCPQIKAKYGECHLIVSGDASGFSRNVTTKGNVNAYTIILQELNLSSSQLKVPNSNPPVSESRTLTNSIFARHPNRKIHPNCKYIIEDLRFVQVKDDGSIDKNSNSHRSHLLDTIRYMDNTFFYDFIPRSR